MLIWKLQSICQMQQICFWVKRSLSEWYVSFPEIADRMAVTLNLFLFLLFIYFCHLTGGMSLFYTPQYQFFKAVSLVFCPHILNVSQYFIQKLPCPSNCQSLFFVFFLSFKEMQIYYCWLNQNNASKCTQSDTGLCAWLFFSKIMCICLNRGRRVKVSSHSLILIEQSPHSVTVNCSACSSVTAEVLVVIIYHIISMKN